MAAIYNLETKEPIESSGPKPTVKYDEKKNIMTFIYANLRSKPINLKKSADDFMSQFLEKNKFKDNSDDDDDEFLANDNIIFKKNLKSSVKNGLNIDQKILVEEFDPPLPPVNINHSGYLNGLLLAWQNYYGIIIGPIYLYNIVLCALSAEINANPEVFRDKRSPDKIKSDCETFNLEALINLAKKQSSFDVDQYIPVFESEPENFRKCMYSTIMDTHTVKSYQSHDIQLDGSFPKIKVCQNIKEWHVLTSCISYWKTLFLSAEKESTLYSYLCEIEIKVQEFIKNLENPEYWRKFFYIERCEFGRDNIVKGHIVPFIHDPDDHKTLINKLPKMISMWKYTIIHKDGFAINGKSFSGISGSRLDEDDVAIPTYYYGRIKDASHNLLLSSEQKKEVEIVSEIVDILDKETDEDEKKTVTKILSAMPSLIRYDEISGGLIYESLSYYGNIPIMLAFFKEYEKNPYVIRHPFTIPLIAVSNITNIEMVLLSWMNQFINGLYLLKTGYREKVRIFLTTSPEILEPVWELFGKQIRESLLRMDHDIFSTGLKSDEEKILYLQENFASIDFDRKVKENFVMRIKYIVAFANFTGQLDKLETILFLWLPNKLSQHLAIYWALADIVSLLKDILNSKSHKKINEIKNDDLVDCQIMMKLTKFMMDHNSIKYDFAKIVSQLLAKYDYVVTPTSPFTLLTKIF